MKPALSAVMLVSGRSLHCLADLVHVHLGARARRTLAALHGAGDWLQQAGTDLVEEG